MLATFFKLFDLKAKRFSEMILILSLVFILYLNY